MSYQTVISHPKVSSKQRHSSIRPACRYEATDSSSNKLYHTVGSENKTAKVVLYRSPEHTDCYVVDRMTDYRHPKVLEVLCNYLCTFIILSALNLLPTENTIAFVYKNQYWSMTMNEHLLEYEPQESLLNKVKDSICFTSICKKGFPSPSSFYSQTCVSSHFQ